MQHNYDLVIGRHSIDHKMILNAYECRLSAEIGNKMHIHSAPTCIKIQAEFIIIRRKINE